MGASGRHGRRLSWTGRADRCGLRLRCRDWTRRGGLLLRQLGNGQFHGALNRDASDALVLIDPAVSGQSLCRLLLGGFQIFHALFCAGFFVIASPLGRTNHREDDHTKKDEKEHDPNPRGQRRPRVDNLAKRFGVGHFSSSIPKIQSSAGRGLERVRSWARVADTRNRESRRWR